MILDGAAMIRYIVLASRGRSGGPEDKREDIGVPLTSSLDFDIKVGIKKYAEKHELQLDQVYVFGSFYA